MVNEKAVRVILHVHTKMEFESVAELEKYLTSDDMFRITGFGQEIRFAMRSGVPVRVKTPRPQFGAVTQSTIEVQTVVDFEQHLASAKQRLTDLVKPPRKGRRRAISR